MKYEMIFGDAGLFDGAPDDAEMVYETANHVRVYYKKCNSLKFFSDNKWVRALNEKAMIIYAMRRIIKEPKRWTVEDQKAGRLPEVGSIFTYRDETLTCHFIDGDGEIWAHDIDNKIVTPLLRDCKPLETPREKYDRERDECIDKLLAKIPPSPITVVPAMKIVYEELRPFTGGDHD